MTSDPDRIRLKGFNNLTKVVSLNLYDFFIARTESERDGYARYIDEHFSADKITQILGGVAKIIDAQVLSVSKQDYEPHGASSLVLMSDLGHESVGAHLTKSHMCAHTYPDWTDPKGMCSFRVDIGIGTCGTIVPLRALDYIFESFENDLVIVDYSVRGFTRDTRGDRVFLDHTVGSIQDFIAPEILRGYHCEDLILQSQNIWQTKMIRTGLEPKGHFPEGTDVRSPENRDALEQLRREMAGIFHNWPS